MGDRSYSEIWERAAEKAGTMCCPGCGSVGSLGYADLEVLVCASCQYSIDAADLQPAWQEKIEMEEGFYD